jgi:hypothetical protein
MNERTMTMKKLKLLFLCLFGAVFLGNAQSGTVSGTIFGAPAGVLVTVKMYDGNTAVGSALVYHDSVYTDTNENFLSNYSFSSTLTYGIVVCSFKDCFSGLVSDTLTWDTNFAANPSNSYHYCPSTSCTTQFSYVASTTSPGQVQFTNMSTPISGRIAFSWAFGDGAWSNDVHPLHTYTGSGPFEVKLVMYDTITNCSSSYIDSIALPVPGIIIAGNVMTLGSNPGDGVVYLITTDTSGSLVVVDTLFISATGGNYAFSITSGTYYVKAALLPSNTDYANYLPTYYSNSLSWTTATAIVVAGASSTGNDITLVQGVNPGGPAFIGGVVSHGVNSSGAPGDPYPGASVILVNDQGQGVAHAITNENGLYTFDGIAYGTYRVFVEIIGKTAHERVVVVSPEKEREEYINFIVERMKVFAGLDNSSNVVLTGVYPNPAYAIAYLNLMVEESIDLSVTLNDLTGRKAMQYEGHLPRGSHQIELDVSELPKGIYFINLSGNDSNKTVKLVKH